MKTTFLIFALALTTVAQPLTRYSYRREVSVQVRGESLIRRSTFTYKDDGKKLIETEIDQTGSLTLNDSYWRSFPVFPILPADVRPKPFKGFAVTWTTEGGITETGDRPWFASDARSGLFFPAKAEMAGKDFSVSVRFYDYRQFTTRVVIKPWEE